MMTPQALLMSYYHDLLLSNLNADSLIKQMCSDGLLTSQERAIISSGHSVHQRNMMLLEYTRHMDIQAVKSFCELVQKEWPQIGSQLSIGKYAYVYKYMHTYHIMQKLFQLSCTYTYNS